MAGHQEYFGWTAPSFLLSDIIWRAFYRSKVAETEIPARGGVSLSGEGKKRRMEFGRGSLRSMKKFSFKGGGGGDDCMVLAILYEPGNFSLSPAQGGLKALLVP